MRSLLFAGIALLVAGSGAISAQGRGTSGAVVTPAKLIAVFPTIAGWTKGEPSGETVTIGMTMTVARVQYEKGDSNISLEITDTATNQMLLSPFMAMTKTGFSEKTREGWRKATTVAGFPGLEAWDSENKSADVMAIVAGRFVVKATANEVADTSMARKVIEAVDFKALSALK